MPEGFGRGRPSLWAGHCWTALASDQICSCTGQVFSTAPVSRQPRKAFRPPWLSRGPPRWTLRASPAWALTPRFQPYLISAERSHRRCIFCCTVPGLGDPCLSCIPREPSILVPGRLSRLPLLRGRHKCRPYNGVRTFLPAALRKRWASGGRLVHWAFPVPTASKIAGKRTFVNPV